MELLSSLLGSMDVIQWVFLGLGVILVAPVLLDFFSKFKDVKVKRSSSNDLGDLIAKWETLADAVHKAGIHEACDLLDEVFPLLIHVREEEINVEPEDSDDK